jgi:hypothetical protein
MSIGDNNFIQQRGYVKSPFRVLEIQLECHLIPDTVKERFGGL